MQAKGWIMFRVLMNRFHKGPIEPALRCLPPEDMRAILAQDVHSTDAAVALTLPQELLKKVHYSWLAPAFKRLPKSLQAALLAMLPEEQRSKMQSQCLEEVPSSGLPAPFLHGILSQILYRNLERTDILPTAFLPRTPLSPLADWNKQKLVELIDLLGVYDLSEEMRQIINKERLKMIQPCLTMKQKAFLRICLHKSEKIATPRLNLDKWDGDERKLHRLLHQRGLLRLGKALCSQHPDLVWHIAHVLDTGRGEEILTHYASPAIPGVTPVLVQQILNVINFLNPKSNQS